MAWLTLDNLTPLEVVGPVIAGIRVTDVAGACGPGLGVLSLSATRTLLWRAPGSAASGPAVDVSAGGAFVLVDGGNADKWLAVDVTVARLPASGQTAGVQLSLRCNGMAGADVAAADAAAGVVQTWTFDLRNRDGAAGKSVALWLDPLGAQQHDLSLDGSTWSKPSAASPLSAGTVAAAGALTVHVRRTVPAGTPRHAGKRLTVYHSATDGTTELGLVAGLYRVWEAAAVRLYAANGAPPDPQDGGALDTQAALPLAASVGDGDWRGRIEVSHGLARVASAAQRVVVAGGVVASPPPPAPQNLFLTQAGGVIKVHAQYFPTGGAGTPTTWQLWHQVSSAPDTDLTPDAETPVYAGAGHATLAYALPAYDDGDDVYVAVALADATQKGPVVVRHLVVSVPTVGAPRSAGRREGA